MCASNSIHFRHTNGCSWESVKSFWDKPCVDPRGTRTPSPRIHAGCSNLLSYQGQTIAVPLLLNTSSGGKDIFEVKLTFEMLTVRGQQHSFSTHERVFLGKCPNLGIHAECSNLLSYHSQTSWNVHILGYSEWVAHTAPMYSRVRFLHRVFRSKQCVSEKTHYIFNVKPALVESLLGHKWKKNCGRYGFTSWIILSTIKISHHV